MPITVQLAELYQPVTAEVADVRDTVSRVWTDALALACGESLGPIGGGGKFLRPALSLLSAGACGAQDLSHFIPLASSIEILHLAALAHDDVIDGADMRRGSKSLKSLWGNHAAVLGGDYLVARSITMMAQYRNSEIIETTMESLREMAEGELSMVGRPDTYRSREMCLDLAQKKTATLFAVACATPALLIRAEHASPLRRYGLALGTAFQLVDDLLDLVQNEETLGKPACGDIMENKGTLPILFMREALDPTDLLRLDRLAGTPLSLADRRWVSEMVEATGARERTETLARTYGQEAQTALSMLPSSLFKDSLCGLAEFILVRES